MTGSWNESSGSEQPDEAWPSFEDALRVHGFDVAPPPLPGAQSVHDEADTAGDEPPMAVDEPRVAEPRVAEPDAIDDPSTAEPEPEPEPAMDAEPAAVDDADAPVLPDVHAQSVFGFDQDAGPAAPVWGETPTSVPNPDQWWLEPDAPAVEAPRDAAANESVAAEPAAEEPAASEPLAPEPEHSAWPSETAWTSDETEPAAATDAESSPSWPGDSTWDSDASPAAQPEAHEIAATAPHTLPDHRPPTPPPSLFARLGRPASVTPPAPEPVPPPPPVREEAPSVRPFAEAPRAIAPEAFHPWEFERPAASTATTGEPAVPAEDRSDRSDFWGDALAAAPSVDAAPVAVDDNWASPGFTTIGEVPPLPESQPYAFGAEGRAPYDAPPAAYEPTTSRSDSGALAVDWYEAAAIEVVGTTTPADASNTEFVGYDEPTESAPAEASAAVLEAPHAPPAGEHEAAPPAFDAWESAVEPGTAHDLIGDDPWASQAFLDRLSEAHDPVAMGPEPAAPDVTGAANSHAEDADHAIASAEAAPVDTDDDAWPALTTEAWPQTTADGWPDAAASNAWSVLGGAQAYDAPAAPPVEAAPETESWDTVEPVTAEVPSAEAAPAEAPPTEPEVQPDSWDAALASLAPSHGKSAILSAEPQAAVAESASAEAPVAEDATRAEPEAEPAVAEDATRAEPEAEPAVAAAAAAEVATAPDEATPEETAAPESTATAAAPSDETVHATTEAADSEPGTHAADAHPVTEAHVITPAPAGPFSRYAAQAEVRAADPSKASAHAADSDLWQLVADPQATSATGTEPAGGHKRTFDPVSIFLTVLVAIVIVVLLAGFVLFAQGLIH